MMEGRAGMTSQASATTRTLRVPWATLACDVRRGRRAPGFPAMLREVPAAG